MINKLSCIDEKATIAKNVKIGPFSFIGKNVNIAKSFLNEGRALCRPAQAATMCG